MTTRATDALGAMYFVAAVLMGIGALVIIVLMFIPTDFLSRSEDAYVPAAPALQPDQSQTAPVEEAPEELHMH